MVCGVALTCAALAAATLGGGRLRSVRGASAAVLGGASTEDASSGRERAFREPELRSCGSGGTLDTSIDVTVGRVGHEAGPVAYTARLYDGAMPGPTLAVRRGGTLRLKLANKLAPNNPFGGMVGAVVQQAMDLQHPFNTLRMPNSTNIHVHGMHVSPAGDADNVFTTLEPGEEAVHVYKVPEDHPSGVFYYHPHFHGSSTIQMAGGMAGAIVVLDEDGDETAAGAAPAPASASASAAPPLPKELGPVRDLVAVLQMINLRSGTFRSLEGAAGASDSLLPMDVDVAAGDEASPYVVVNGIRRPLLSVEQGETTRLRLVHAGVNDYLHVGTDGGDGCELAIMARDGQYFRETRAVETFVMAPGSRADVLLRCREKGRVTLASTAPPEGLVGDYYGQGTDFHVGAILDIRVGPGRRDALEKGDALKDLPVAAGAFPEDLLGREPDLAFDLEYGQGPRLQLRNPAGEGGSAYKWYGVNGRAYAGSKPKLSVPLGAVVDFRIWNERERSSDGDAPTSSIAQPDGEDQRATTNHPAHVHTNHFQIVNSSFSGDNLDWRVGDWRDTISVPTPGFVTVRWRAEDFVGTTLFHCHIFSHSDTGMALPFEIVDAARP